MPQRTEMPMSVISQQEVESIDLRGVLVPVNDDLSQVLAATDRAHAIWPKTIRPNRSDRPPRSSERHPSMPT